MSVKALTDLSGLKEEHIAQLAGLGIKSVADMKKALGDEQKVKEMIKTLSGVGPKTVDKWKGELEGVDDAKAAAVPAVAEKKTEIIEDDDDEDEYIVKAKPELDEGTQDALAKRAIISGNRPAFKRQEWFRYSKLGEGWRKPKGIHSKMKRKLKRRPPVVVIGYRGPKAARGLHPSGFEEVHVQTINELEGVDPKKQAVRIGGTVGTRKRIMIEDRAEELGIRVLNRMV
ncbi:MAG: 50S ribosomal protein L32e [Methanomassiliicoccaceae archaeon]|nr:50S ribosomal protein L32e [Methanomassiliicoccaceae archaeon]